MMSRTTALALAALLALPAAAQSVTDKIDGLTANQGLYGNHLPDRTFPWAFTVVCIAGGGVLSDRNMAGASPQGGACRPLMKGWVIERDEPGEATWTEARIACTIDGLRLAEVMEWQFSCFNVSDFGMVNMIRSWEWSGNTAFAEHNRTPGIATALLVDAACEDGLRGRIARVDEFAFSTSFRCVR